MTMAIGSIACSPMAMLVDHDLASTLSTTKEREQGQGKFGTRERGWGPTQLPIRQGPRTRTDPNVSLGRMEGLLQQLKLLHLLLHIHTIAVHITTAPSSTILTGAPYTTAAHQ